MTTPLGQLAELAIYCLQVNRLHVRKTAANLRDLLVALAKLCECLVHPGQLLFRNAHVINVTGKGGFVKSFARKVA